MAPMGVTYTDDRFVAGDDEVSIRSGYDTKEGIEGTPTYEPVCFSPPLGKINKTPKDGK